MVPGCADLADFADFNTQVEGGLEVRLCNSESELTPMGHAWLNVTAATDPNVARIVDCDAVPPPSPPPLPVPAPPAIPDACPFLAALTVGRVLVSVQKPDAPNDQCDRMGSKPLCDQSYRWRPANSNGNLQLHLCQYDDDADKCAFQIYECPASPPPLTELQGKQCVTTANGATHCLQIPVGSSLFDEKIQKMAARHFGSPLV